MNVISLPTESVSEMLQRDYFGKKYKRGNSLLIMISYRLQVKRENSLLHSCGYHTESLSLS